MLVAGDVARATDDPNYNGGACGTAGFCHMKATSDLLVANPDATVLALGDLQYNSASPAAFQAVYDPTWGRVKAIRRRSTTTRRDRRRRYFTYFGAAATPLEPACRTACKGYYSFDVGTWHVVVLNTECTRIDNGAGCAVGSLQEQWLRSDLALRTASRDLGGWAPAPVELEQLRELGHRAAGRRAVREPGRGLLQRTLPRVRAVRALEPAGAGTTPRGSREFVVGTGGDSSGFGTTSCRTARSARTSCSG